MAKKHKITSGQPLLTFLATSRPALEEDKAARLPTASRDGRDATKTVGASHASATASSVSTQPSPVFAVCGRPMDSSFDLPDSTDWIQTTLPSFEPLEAALRCEICKEFYSNPVITLCHHTFCSICIRRCIATDGKCPSCMTVCSSDKLAPNIAIREVVTRFQEARPKAMELARADKEAADAGSKKKKRKLEDTDIEDDDDGRHTRSRTTRSRGQRNRGAVVVADSEDEDDDDFVPDGMVKCPVCNKAMKEALVFNHLDVCKGSDASQERNTRSKNSTAFPAALQRRQKDDSPPPPPPPTRLSQFNYAMLKESALRKKLQEAGIPSWGTKDLMKRRHIEWLNIHNSNCDAEDKLRKSKNQLLRELEQWEKTQGGRAEIRESKIMKKDFDGQSYAKSNKSEFDELIARARQKRGTPKTSGESSTGQTTPAGGESQGNPLNDVKISYHQPSPNHGSSTISPPPLTHPYENNESALASIRAKVAEANFTSPKAPTLASEISMKNARGRDPAIEGIQNPLGTPSRNLPMFALPEDPVLDVEGSTALQ